MKVLIGVFFSFFLMSICSYANDAEEISIEVTDEDFLKIFTEGESKNKKTNEKKEGEVHETVRVSEKTLVSPYIFPPLENNNMSWPFGHNKRSIPYRPNPYNDTDYVMIYEFTRFGPIEPLPQWVLDEIQKAKEENPQPRVGEFDKLMQDRKKASNKIEEKFKYFESTGKLNVISRPIFGILQDMCFENPTLIDGLYSLQEICQTVTESEICKKVPKNNRLDCNTLENGFALNIWSFLTGCTHGVYKVARNLLILAWDILEWSWENITSEEARTETYEHATEYMRMLKLYLHVEYNRAILKEEGMFKEAKALTAVAGTIGSTLMSIMSNAIVEKFEMFGCLSLPIRSKIVCEMFADIVIPPGGGTAVLKYGKHAFKKFPHLMKALDKAGRAVQTVLDPPIPIPIPIH